MKRLATAAATLLIMGVVTYRRRVGEGCVNIVLNIEETLNPQEARPSKTQSSLRVQVPTRTLLVPLNWGYMVPNSRY